MRSSWLAGILATAASTSLLPAPLASGQETRISVDSNGTEGDAESNSPVLSADAVLIAFESRATNLVSGDTNGKFDIFLHDRSTGFTERVSIRSNGNQANGDSSAPVISSDGQVIGFMSKAGDLVNGDRNLASDFFVHERSTGLTERVSVSSTGAEGNADTRYGSLSSDGKLVAFDSDASNLVTGDTNRSSDVFIHDRTTGSTERVSVDSSGAEGNGGSSMPALSADGSIVAFDSYASNLIAGDTNGTQDVFVRDRSAATTEVVSVDSVGTLANGFSFRPAISPDGRFVAFGSWATNLVPGDTNGVEDFFVHDRATGTTERVSVSSSGAQANSDSQWASISPDGRMVAFDSGASNLVAGDTNGTRDIFLHDRSTGNTSRISVDSHGAQGNGSSYYASICADGMSVAFESSGTNLVPGDTNSSFDDFVWDFCTTAASWSNYGSGFAGTFGIPSFTSQQNPVLGTNVTLDLQNSRQQPTAGLLVLGWQRADLPTSWGSDLLVAPALTLPITFSFGFDSFSGDIPYDSTLCGVTIDLQALEADPGAAKGVSFTPGLELVLGL